MPKFDTAIELAGWVWTLPCFANVTMDVGCAKELAAAIDKFKAPPFGELVEAVRVRYEQNATHKRGFRLQDKPPLNPLLHAIEEATEVARADLCGESRGRIEEELGDTITGLLIYAKARGLSLDRVMQGACEKIARDIVLPEEGPDA